MFLRANVTLIINVQPLIINKNKIQCNVNEIPTFSKYSHKVGHVTFSLLVGK